MLLLFLLNFLVQMYFRPHSAHPFLQANDPVRAAKLSRFAACLTLLQDRHKRALVQNAAQLNMEAGNYGCVPPLGSSVELQLKIAMGPRYIR